MGWTRVLSGIGSISQMTFKSSSVGWLDSSMTIDLVVVFLVVLLICRSFLSSSCTLGARGAKNCLCYQLLPFDSFFVKEGWPCPGHPWINIMTLQNIKNQKSSTVNVNPSINNKTNKK